MYSQVRYYHRTSMVTTLTATDKMHRVNNRQKEVEFAQIYI